jgi:hypothetical protein
LPELMTVGCINMAFEFRSAASIHFFIEHEPVISRNAPQR